MRPLRLGPLRPRTGLLLLVASVSAACLSLTPTPVPAATARLRAAISEPGVYRLTRQDLLAAGLAVSPDELDRLGVTTRGEPLAALLEQNGDDFALLFYADPQPTRYSASQIYWLTLGENPAARMAERPVVPSASAAPAGNFPASLTLEENHVYVSKPVPKGENWVWETLVAPTRADYPFSLSGVAAGGGNAALEVVLMGVTVGAHHVRVAVNGQDAGELKWEGVAVGTGVFQFDAGLLRDGENTLTLLLPGDAGAEVNQFDRARLTYPHRFEARDGVLAFGGEGDSYAVSGLGGETLLLDVTDSLQPVRLTGAGDDSFSFTDHAPGAQPTPGPRKYIAVSGPGFRQPDSLLPAHPDALTPRNQQGDYLIIAHASLLDAVRPLADYRARQGLSVRLIDVQQIYDAFGHGAPDPHAIREFLLYARSEWTAPAPRFVLLVGKATYDYRNYLGGPNPNLIPVFLVDTPHLGQAASDNWYVAGEDGLYPAMAIGRLPAETPEQVKIVVEKIKASEAAFEAASAPSWQNRVVFVTDDEDPGFDASAREYITHLPPGASTVQISLAEHAGDVDATRAEIISNWNDGALLITYVGHGAVTSWAAGPLFSVGDLPALKNRNRLPVMLTPTCLDGFFYHPEIDSLAEQLLFKQNGGIIAGLVPTGLSVPAGQDLLMNALFDQLFDESAPTLGEAVMNARLHVADPSTLTREVLQTFVILGDPALRWRP